MNPIGSINPLASAALTRIDAPLPPGLGNIGGAQATPPAEGFGKVLDGLVSMVENKQASAQAVTRQVLLGDSGQLHQSVIAMQEASVAFSMMVEVRNKLVDSYQELMRMQV